jgi:hypothetical protein
MDRRTALIPSKHNALEIGTPKMRIRDQSAWALRYKAFGRVHEQLIQ